LESGKKDLENIFDKSTERIDPLILDKNSLMLPIS